MPTNRRYRRKHRSRQLDQLPVGLEWELTTGVGMVNTFDSIDEMRAAWKIHRSRIMREWAQHCPGKRPFAWWLFEAVPKYGERLVVNPLLARNAARHHGILHTSTIPATQEPEVFYLRRHDLLTAAEKLAVN